MRRYKAVIFDMDGTLLDTLEDLKDATNHALKQFGMPQRTLDEVRRFVGNGVRRLLELAVPEGTDAEQFEAVFAEFKAYYAVHSNDKTKAYDGILPLLHRLQEAGYGMAIVSNKLDSAVKDLSELYFEGIIKTAIGDREGLARKPRPDMVEAALAELGVKKEEAVYVGDSEVDILTAKNAGLDCITVLWGFRDQAFLMDQGATCFAKTPEEILRYL